MHRITKTLALLFISILTISTAASVFGVDEKAAVLSASQNEKSEKTEDTFITINYNDGSCAECKVYCIEYEGCVYVFCCKKTYAKAKEKMAERLKWMKENNIKLIPIEAENKKKTLLVPLQDESNPNVEKIYYENIKKIIFGKTLNPEKIIHENIDKTKGIANAPEGLLNTPKIQHENTPKKALENTGKINEGNIPKIPGKNSPNLPAP